MTTRKLNEAIPQDHKIHIVVVEPGKRSRIEEIPWHGAFKAVQKLCDGFIEAVPLFEEPPHRLAIWCNEEGLLRGLPWNRLVPGAKAPMAGTLVIVAEQRVEGEWQFNDMAPFMQILAQTYFDTQCSILKPTPSNEPAVAFTEIETLRFLLEAAQEMMEEEG